MAKIYCLVQLSQQHADEPITGARLRAIGRDSKFFDGVPEMFGRLRECAAVIVPDIEVCFYLLAVESICKRIALAALSVGE